MNITLTTPNYYSQANKFSGGLRLVNAGVSEGSKYNKIPYLDHLVVIKIPDVTEGRLKTFTSYQN